MYTYYSTVIKYSGNTLIPYIFWDILFLKAQWSVEEEAKGKSGKTEKNRWLITATALLAEQHHRYHIKPGTPHKTLSCDWREREREAE